MVKSWVAASLFLSAFTAAAYANDVAAPTGVKIQESVVGNVYANADGLTLYSSTQDNKPGKVSCTHNTAYIVLEYDCLIAFHPFVAPDGVSPVGDWSVITRSDDGTRQWAFRGRPVYTYKFDTRPGSVNAETGSRIGGFNFGSGPWSALRLSKTMAPGVGTQTSAIGEVLSNAEGMTLYTTDAGACAGACLEDWSPLAAASMARSVEDFTVTTRDDGTKQWTYKGKPLYAFAGDRSPGETAGEGVGHTWHAVVMQPNEAPPAGVTVAGTVEGNIYADAQGKTLYGYFGQFPVKDVSAVSHECTDKCDRIWHPAAVPENAHLSGSWSAITLSDGAKQLAYKGLPLYVYYADKQPGDLLGNEYGRYPTEWFSAIRAKGDLDAN